MTHKGEPKDVAVVTLDQLMRFLTRTVSPSRGSVSTELVRHAALQPCTWAPRQPESAPTTAHIEWFTGLRVRVRVAARRRTAWILGSVVVVLGIPIATGMVAVGGRRPPPLTALKCNAVWVRDMASRNVGCLTYKAPSPESFPDAVSGVPQSCFPGVSIGQEWPVRDCCVCEKRGAGANARPLFGAASS